MNIFREHRFPIKKVSLGRGEGLAVSETPQGKVTRDAPIIATKTEDAWHPVESLQDLADALQEPDTVRLWKDERAWLVGPRDGKIQNHELHAPIPKGAPRFNYHEDWTSNTIHQGECPRRFSQFPFVMLFSVAENGLHPACDTVPRNKFLRHPN